MSVNSSSSFNHSLLHPHLSSINSSVPPDIYCLITRPGSLIFTSFNITYILLLLPLSIFVLYLGVQRWRQQRSSSTSAKTSHSDIFTYNMVTMELVGVFGGALCCSGVNKHFHLLNTGISFFTFAWYGEMFFHILTCVERYLAVVHPITYLSLRKERGIRIRNISIGCVWMFCFIATYLLMVANVLVIMSFCLLFFSSIIISFFSLSVLCTLIRPKPGEQSRDRQRVDQSKQRAFYTIMVILGVLLLRCACNLLWVVMHVLSDNPGCVLITCEVWFNLPSSLVLPLLFLHRSGKLECFSQIRNWALRVNLPQPVERDRGN